MSYCKWKSDQKHFLLLSSPPVTGRIPCQWLISACTIAKNSSSILFSVFPMNWLTSLINAFRSCLMYLVGRSEGVVSNHLLWQCRLWPCYLSLSPNGCMYHLHLVPFHTKVGHLCGYYILLKFCIYVSGGIAVLVVSEHVV